MKNIIFICILLSICLHSCASDSNDSSTDVKTMQDSLIASPAVTPVNEQPSLPTPIISEKKQKVLDDQFKNSPFKSLGCCSDEAKSNEEDCCCSHVILSYKKMFESKKKGLGTLKDKDPILSYCRKLRKKAFEEIDNPPSAKPGEDDGI